MTLSVESLSILYEEYEYSEKLGCGKFGSVYKVTERETGIMIDLLLKIEIVSTEI